MEENVIQINGGTTINVDVSLKTRLVREKYYIQNPSTCSCENREYLASIMKDSAIMCNEVIAIRQRNKNHSTKF